MILVPAPSTSSPLCSCTLPHLLRFPSFLRLLLRLNPPHPLLLGYFRLHRALDGTLRSLDDPRRSLAC